MHNAFAQQNSFDCGVWTCYAMYHRALHRATEQDPANIFKDMNLKTPEDARRFRSLLSRVMFRLPAVHVRMLSHAHVWCCSAADMTHASVILSPCIPSFVL